MLEKRIQAIVLAAGKSTRFATGNTKLAERICGQEMILFVTTLLDKLAISTSVVVGYQKDLVKSIIKKKHGDNVSFIEQQEQHGTGHAILCSQDTWTQDNILIINGDMPLVNQEIINDLYEQHVNNDAQISFVTSHIADPQVASYGRVIKENGTVKIIEAGQLSGKIDEYCCVNAGIYIVQKDFLTSHISDLQRNEQSEEFYITDLVAIASQNNGKIVTLSAPFDQVRGINTFQELWAAEHLKRSELIKYWMERGVRFSAPQSVHIDLDVKIGKGTYLGNGIHLLKNTTIGDNCIIEEFNSLENVTVGNNTRIEAHCIVKNSTIGNHAIVGPFAHVRENSHIGDNAHIGNFVEVKKTTIGSHSKAKHLTYLGDTTIGNNVNIGAGTITCNHNGVRKEKTTILDGVFVGSNNTLVAPVTIGKDSFTAAGSTITKDVPQGALAFGRSRQENKEGYAQKLKQSRTDEDTTSTSEPEPEVSFIAATKTKHKLFHEGL